MKVLLTQEISNIEGTEMFAEQVLEYLKEGTTVGLIGGLGAGKTTFTKLLLKKMGYKEDVSSPTYVLQHEYLTPLGVVEHWDLYRLNCSAMELTESGDSKNIRLIEWADKFDEVLALLDYTLKIDVDDKGIRYFQFMKV